MQNCLGLYIENNLIKYAKISKDKDNYKVESFGLKFYDDIEETIQQIINETYSFKTPIAVNLSDEKYTYAQLFNLLSKKDLEKAIETEFELFCNETGKNRKALDYKRILVPDLVDKDKITSLYAYTDKSDIVRKLQILDSYTVKDILPLPITISNLSTFANKKNSIIVNIEKNTSVTTVINGNIQRVDIIEKGSKDILDSIILKENSYKKAYEICKDTTIYTTEGKNLQIEENDHLDDIMPVLYSIIEELKQIIAKNEIDINNIFITGLGAIINNIDLYFQENFPNYECEILTPFFIQKTNIKINIKDYIEVNSAISLALQGMDRGYKEVNFKKTSKLDKLSIDIGAKKDDKEKNPKTKNLLEKFKNTLKTEGNTGFDAIDMSLTRTAISLIILLVIYVIFSSNIINNINKKDKNAQDYILDTQSKISEVEKNTRLVNERTTQYRDIIARIDEANNKLSESYARKNALPNLMTQIMFNVPKEVQLISIENTTGKTIKIEAQSEEYEQLGYFIAKIKNEGILTDVTSTSGLKQTEYVKITIQGNLPY